MQILSISNKKVTIKKKQIIKIITFVKEKKTLYAEYDFSNTFMYKF